MKEVQNTNGFQRNVHLNFELILKNKNNLFNE